MTEREPYHSLAKGVIILSSLYLVSQLAFSKKTKDEIYRRDGGKSALSGLGGKLHAAHISHRRDKNYDKPSNGRLLTIGEHFWDHINRQGRNGLSKEVNDWAIWRLWKTFWGID